MRSRRSFLGLVGGAAVTAGLPATSFAASDDGSFDISYLWVPELDALLDYREIVTDTLGWEIARDLIVVRGGTGNWGLLLDRTNTSRVEARKVANNHHRRLRQAIGGRETLATVLPDRGFDRTYHVRYGEYRSLSQARAAFMSVVDVMGPEVENHLVVEQVMPARWHVVYKRYGTRRSTERVALAHTKLLAKQRIQPSAVPDRFLSARWAAHSTDGIAESATPGLVVPAHRSSSSTTEGAATRSAPATPAPKVEPPPPRLPATARVITDNDLPAAIATPLRNAINQHIQKLRRKGKIDNDERTSWYVHTLHDDRTWAAINAELRLQCASMFKPYVALAFLHQANAGQLIYGQKSKTNLERMIQYSSNDATNWAMQKVGGPQGMQRILQRNYGEIFQETSIVEFIPKSGRTYKNRSSARDYVRFSRSLWNNELPFSNEIRRLMALPGRDRLATGAPSIPASTKVMNKTGTTSHLVGDFGILVARTKDGAEVPYAIAGIIEKRHRARSFSSWTASRSAVIRGVSNLVYQKLQSQYALS